MDAWATTYDPGTTARGQAVRVVVRTAGPLAVVTVTVPPPDTGGEQDREEQHG